MANEPGLLQYPSYTSTENHKHGTAVLAKASLSTYIRPLHLIHDGMPSVAETTGSLALMLTGGEVGEDVEETVDKSC
jgi:hypothetical protein